MKKITHAQEITICVYVPQDATIDTLCEQLVKTVRQDFMIDMESEDVRMEREISDFFDYAAKNGFMREEDYENCPAWSRWMKKQNARKPFWSSQDEENEKDVCLAIQQRYPNNIGPYLIKWLTSLRSRFFRQDPGDKHMKNENDDNAT